MSRMLPEDFSLHPAASPEEVLDALLERLPIRVFWKDRESKYLGCNEAFARDAGAKSPEALIGLTDFELGWRDQAEMYRWDDAQVMESGKARYFIEEPQTTPGGKTIWLRTSKVPLRDRNGEVIGLLGMYEDITERRELELELKRREQVLLEAKRQAEEASHAKSRFLAMMSHEIRTPLNGVLGMAQLMATSEMNEEERRQGLQVILESGRLLLGLLNDVLDLSKVEAGKLQLEQESFSVPVLAEEIERSFQREMQRKGLAFSVKWGGSAANLIGDPLRIRQMLGNLIGNALKFTEQGGVQVVLSDSPEPDGWVVLRGEVSDDGIGIPESGRISLFTPFSQVDASATRRFGGSGLGLSIVRYLAEQMGGHVGFDSTENRGSRFWFTVRLKVAPSSTFSSQISAKKTVETVADCSVLIVEDNSVNREVLRRMLRRLGVSVACVSDGQQALNVLTSTARPALVFMDCQMPVMDGFEATRGVRAWEAMHPQVPRVPILALTASVYEDDRRLAQEAGMDAFLTKPVEVDKLSSALRQWLRPEVNP